MDIDPGLAALFGSEQRARTLAVLANSSRPLTGYRVAKETGDERTKVYAQIRRLAAVGIIVGKPTSRGKPGWTIADPNLRALLRRAVRLVLEEDWLASATERDRRSGSIFARLRSMPHATPAKGWQPKHPERFRRSPKKDEILRRMSRPTSLHADP